MWSTMGTSSDDHERFYCPTSIMEITREFDICQFFFEALMGQSDHHMKYIHYIRW